MSNHARIAAVTPQRLTTLATLGLVAAMVAGCGPTTPERAAPAASVEPSPDDAEVSPQPDEITPAERLLGPQPLVTPRHPGPASTASPRPE